MLYNQIIKEGIVGFCTFAAISYLAQKYTNFSNFYKISAFLYVLPMNNH